MPGVRLSTAPEVARISQQEKWGNSLWEGELNKDGCPEAFLILEQLLFAYNHSAIDEDLDFLTSLDNNVWHKMDNWLGRIYWLFLCASCVPTHPIQ